MVSFIPESCLPFAQIIEFYQKTAATAWNCFFFPFGKFRPGIQDYFFRCSRCSGIFFSGTTPKAVLHVFFKRICRETFCFLNWQTASTFPRIVWLGGVVGGWGQELLLTHCCDAHSTPVFLRVLNQKMATTYNEKNWAFASSNSTCAMQTTSAPQHLLPSRSH